MIPTLNDIQIWFNEFNASVFNNELPTVKMSLTNNRRQLGQFYWGYSKGIGIKVSAYYDAPVEDLRNTVLHEMCHLYCHHKGWVGEHHGRRWQQIAAYATRKTGLEITRTHDISNYKVAEKNTARHEALQAKKEAPVIILDLEYPTYHFLVKTTKNVLKSDDSTDCDCKVRTRATSYRVVITDNERFRKWQSSRSIRRGYKYETYKYNSDIKPILDKGIEVENLYDLFNCHYNCLGIR